MTRPFRIPTSLSLAGHWIPLWDEHTYQSYSDSEADTPPIFALNARPVFCPLLQSLSEVATGAVRRAWPIGLISPQAFIGITLTWQDPVSDICRPLQPGIECWLEDTDLWYLTLWTTTLTYTDFQEIDRLLGHLQDVLQRVPFFRSFCSSAIKTMRLPECVPSPPPRAKHPISSSSSSSSSSSTVTIIDEESFEMVSSATDDEEKEDEHDELPTLSLLERLETLHPISC